ncbi:MAG: twin-arginine translocase TatA/TatE family subunit [Ilumatobacteraceae bacterium]
MFNLTGTEIVVILLLALVVLGPEKLPDAIRRFGRTYAELKKLSTGFQQEFRSALDEPVREMRESADMLRRSADFDADAAPDLRPADDPPQSEPTTELPFGERDAGDETPADEFTGESDRR